jgi:cytochrome c556
MVAGFGLALGVAILGTNKGRSDDDEDFKVNKEAGEAVAKLLEALDKPGDGTKKAAEGIKAKYAELKPVMSGAFKPRKAGGIGAGPVDANDGVETRILKWDSPKSRPLGPADVVKQKETLEKVAEVSRGMADVAEQYAPTKAGDAAKWKKYNDAMRKAAKDLSDATKGGDAAAVRKAITNLHASCTDCHGDFRDNTGG